MKTMAIVTQKFDRIGRTTRLAAWSVLGVLLITVGFLMDGTTETGHHVFLILGGTVIGAGAMREFRG